MSLSNTLMYEGKLECGSERTASAVLQLATRDSVERDLELFIGQEEYMAWIQEALQPLNPVCFLDTTKVSPDDHPFSIYLVLGLRNEWGQLLLSTL